MLTREVPQFMGHNGLDFVAAQVLQQWQPYAQRFPCPEPQKAGRGIGRGVQFFGQNDVVNLALAHCLRKLSDPAVKHTPWCYGDGIAVINGVWPIGPQHDQEQRCSRQ